MQEDGKKILQEKIHMELNEITKDTGYLTKMASAVNKNLIELDQFSLRTIYDIFKDPTIGCPTLLDLLEFAAQPRQHQSASQDVGWKTDEVRRNNIITIICMLAKVHSQRASLLQKVTSLCLLSKGAKRSVLDLLNKQGICQGYKQSHRYVKDLSELVRSSAEDFCISKIHQGYMVIFDNFNMSMRVSHQRIDKKNQFCSWVVGLITPIYREPSPDAKRDVPIGNRKDFIRNCISKIIPAEEDFEEVSKFFFNIHLSFC